MNEIARSTIAWVVAFNGRRQSSLRWYEPDEPRGSGRFCETLGVKFPGPTRQARRCTNALGV